MATTTILGVTLTLTPTVLTALRILPLTTATVSLTHAYMEWVTSSSFVGPAPVDSSISRFLINKSIREISAIKTDINATEQAQKDVEAAKELMIPEWFTHFFNTGVLSVIGFNNLALVAAALNLNFDHELGDSKIFYQAGLGLAVAHYAFVPLVAPSISALIGMAARRRKGAVLRLTGGEKEAIDWIREWFGYHKLGMSTVDLFAWICFA